MKYDVEIDIKPHQTNKRRRGMFALNFTELLYLGQTKIYVCLGLPDLPYFVSQKKPTLFHFIPFFGQGPFKSECFSYFLSQCNPNKTYIYFGPYIHVVEEIFYFAIK